MKEKKNPREEIVVVFSDEMDEDELALLAEDVEETDFMILEVFDAGNKLIADVPSEIPDPDFNGTLEEYWMDVLNDSQCPCCDPRVDSEISVWAVYRLKDFIKKDKKLNPKLGGAYRDIWEKYL
jgi:hypothetical protein